MTEDGSMSRIAPPVDPDAGGQLADRFPATLSRNDVARIGIIGGGCVTDAPTRPMPASRHMETGARTAPKGG